MLTPEYISQALRTKSDKYHTDVVSEMDVKLVFGVFEGAAVVADVAKKGIFYGKAPTSSDISKDKAKAAMDSVLANPLPPRDTTHALLGLITEVAELSVAARTGDRVKMIDELGDLFWYQALFCFTNGLDPVEVMTANIAKLRARFPDKFEASFAINKDDGVEKTALESALSVQ